MPRPHFSRLDWNNASRLVLTPTTVFFGFLAAHRWHSEPRVRSRDRDFHRAVQSARFEPVLVLRVALLDRLSRRSRQAEQMNIRPPPKGLGRTAKAQAGVGPRCYDNQALFPTFGVSDYESLLVKLAEIGVRPYQGRSSTSARMSCGTSCRTTSSSRRSRSSKRIGDR